MRHILIKADEALLLTLSELKILFIQAKQLQAQREYARASSIFYYLQQKLPHFSACFFEAGICQMHISFWEGAKLSFEKHLNLAAYDADSICNLAIIYWKTGQLKHALSYFKFNLKHHPHHHETHLNLASVYQTYPKHIHKAIPHYQFLLQHKPQSLDLRFNLAASLQKKGLYEAACQQYLVLLQNHPKHVPSLYNLGCLYWQQQQKQAAFFYWQTALTIYANPKLQYLIDCLMQDQVNEHEHNRYIEALFNDYAHHYDRHLMQDLAYQLPSFLHNYSQNKRFERSLELGCGSGLCGPILKKISLKLQGLDISKDMLNHAQKTGAYDGLVHANYSDFLQDIHDEFDLIAAIDVSPYILNIQDFLRLCHQSLTKNAHLWLSFELQSSQTQLRKTYSLSEALACIDPDLFELNYQEQMIGRREHHRDCEILFLDLKTRP